jgi:hypothetical protein
VQLVAVLAHQQAVTVAQLLLLLAVLLIRLTAVRAVNQGLQQHNFLLAVQVVLHSL